MGKITKLIIFIDFGEEKSFLNQRRSWRDSKPNFWKSFSLGVPLIASVIARQALYWNNSSLWWRESRLCRLCHILYDHNQHQVLRKLYIMVKSFIIFVSPMVFYLLMTAFSDSRKVLISRQVKYRGVSEMKVLETWMLLKNNGGWLIFFNVWLKMTSRTCLLRSGLKFIFHWKAQSLILA